MTQDDACNTILRLGGTEYPDRIAGKGVRCFEMDRLDGPDCACNDRPPSLHVRAYPDIQHSRGVHIGGVEFRVVGEAGDGRWLNAKIYSVDRGEIAEVLPDVRITAGLIWRSFVVGMAGRRE